MMLFYMKKNDIKILNLEMLRTTLADISRARSEMGLNWKENIDIKILQTNVCLISLKIKFFYSLTYSATPN